MKVDVNNLDLDAKIEVDEDFKDAAEQEIISILTNEHDHPQKHRVKRRRNRLQFACPYCGDSEKRMTKKRGNLFWDGLFFHCFNGGCPSPHVDFATFLYDFGLSKEEIRDRFGSFSLLKKFSKDRAKSSPFKKERITDNSVKGDIFKLIVDKSIPVSTFAKITKARKVDKDSKMFNYLKGRNQHKNLGKFLVDTKGNLLVLNLTADKRGVIGFQKKLFRDDIPYVTYDIQRMYQELLKQELGESEDMTFRLNQMSTIFNIMSVRLTGVLTVLEGPLDSFLFPNSIALASAGKDTSRFEQLPRTRFMFDNDDTGKKYALEKLNKGLPVFLWKKFITDFEIKERIKDFNDLVNYSVSNQLQIMNKIDQYFSNYEFDSFYL